METGNLIVFIGCLVASGFFVAIGVPCSQGWVRPNRLYGFRTRKTLQDPDVWYPTNRVAGYWGIATGVVAAGVSISTFFAGLELPAAAWINLVPFIVGIVGTLIHGFVVIRRVTRDKLKAGTE
jgi:hypothetical protein